MKKLLYKSFLGHHRALAMIGCLTACTANAVAAHPQSSAVEINAFTLSGYISIAFLLLIVAVCVTIYIYTQRRRIAVLKAHAKFIKEMPWAYSSAKILYDEHGIIYDIEYNLDDMNSAFRNLLSENKMPDAEWKVFPYEFISEKVKKMLDSSQPISFTYHFEKTDTYYEIQLCQINPTTDKAGRPSKIDIFANNITKRKRQEQALIAAEEQARESDRLKSAFLANMSHEIRTPLNAIVGFSGLISQTEDKEEQAKYAAIIEHNNDLLLHLINDVLDLAKIESNTVVLNHVDTDLNEIMHSIYDTVRLRIGDNVVFNMVLGADECQMRVDPNRLSQVLINLLTNAAKFTSKGSITYGYEINDDEIEFFVRDTGIGISKEDQKKLFQRFSKLNNFVQGTGLGLSICKSIVEKMGGTIWVRSRGEGKGTTFYFTIPYTPAKLPSRLEMAEDSAQNND